MIKAYPAGWPLWQSVGRRGFPILVSVKVTHDEEAGVYVAHDSNLRGLVAEGATMDQLIKNLDQATLDLLASYLHKPPVTPTVSLAYCPA